MSRLLFIVILGFFFASFSNKEIYTNQFSQQEVVQGKVKDINVETFNDLINSKKGTILDVRTPDEWTEGTIVNAQKMNFYDDDFGIQVDDLDKTKPVFVYCKRGGRSASSAAILKEKGFVKIYNLDGGMDAWKAEGEQITKQ